MAHEAPGAWLGPRVADIVGRAASASERRRRPPPRNRRPSGGRAASASERRRDPARRESRATTGRTSSEVRAAERQRAPSKPLRGQESTHKPRARSTLVEQRAPASVVETPQGRNPAQPRAKSPLGVQRRLPCGGPPQADVGASSECAVVAGRMGVMTATAHRASTVTRHATCWMPCASRPGWPNGPRSGCLELRRGVRAPTHEVDEPPRPRRSWSTAGTPVSRWRVRGHRACRSSR